MAKLQCPLCCRQVKLTDEAAAVLREKNGRGFEAECADGHTFTLHDAVMSAKLQPMHHDVFLPLQGIEQGRSRIRVGEWKMVRLGKPFDHVDDVKTAWYPAEEGVSLLSVRAEARYDNTAPHEFWLMTSGDELEWGQQVVVDWAAYGGVPAGLEVWRENLIFAARQFLSANYRPCVIQSAVAVESFVYDVVPAYLRDSAKWNAGTVKDYIAGGSRDALSLSGVIRVCIRETMGVQISQQVWDGWRRLKEMRDALAHGNLDRYGKLADANGQPFPGERHRAMFAYEAAVRFIYDVRYPVARRESNA